MPSLWRRLTATQRAEVLRYRQKLQRPWHRPPHFEQGCIHYHLTAACYNHQPIIGATPERMAEFSESLLEALPTHPAAWCVLPNHYHLLIRTDDLKAAIKSLTRLHGRTSYEWNGKDSQRGRKIWHGVSDRGMRSAGHFWATLNYIHHNSVHHGYAEQWTEWPFSSAGSFLDEIGRDAAAELWRTHPILSYGQGWDDSDL
ncbi:hypothetical protein HAHE_23370 [Haloferula helveola]|uniref:Transposase IS200-like domain-containing protein n=1 Tax=Haloferula helveola TaxID=490095 RepID=A0ABM7RAI2_9BACT|nr:hypothetical protein HAHE_23370 [Haloferula helveola]